MPASASAFTIDIDWDPSVASAPSGFTSDILAAVAFLEAEFTDPVTITINVGYGEVDGNAIGGDLGESDANLINVSYADLLAALTTDATTPIDASVLASLPAVSPISGAAYWLTTAQAKALGVAGANGTAVDGSIGFGTGSRFTFGDSNNSGTVAPGTYDFFATAVHEITEVMGRQLLAGGAEGGLENSYTLLDLLHYSAPGVRDLVAATPGYFSANGGVTDLGAFNTVAGGDPGDWASSVTDDPFDAFAASGVLQPVTQNDLTVMDAIGWQPTGSGGTIVPPSETIGVSFAAVTKDLVHAEGAGGLAAGIELATISAEGGGAGDQFDYILGGAGAGSFALVSLGNGAVLSTGSGGASGGVPYALSVTATDETAAGNPAGAGLVNVVVDDTSGDTINLLSLPGVAGAAPSFVYALGGDETVNGAGITGNLYVDCGAGGGRRPAPSCRGGGAGR